jgi:Domain of unknown function (DUF6894)
MRYFFHTRSEDGDEDDVDGIELPSVEVALSEARKSAREIVAERVLHQERIDHMRFEITDDHGRVLGTVFFRDVVNLN